MFDYFQSKCAITLGEVNPSHLWKAEGYRHRETISIHVYEVMFILSLERYAITQRKLSQFIPM